jgi:type IV secretory pathway VirB10-like protein
MLARTRIIWIVVVVVALLIAVLAFALYKKERVMEQKPAAPLPVESPQPPPQEKRPTYAGQNRAAPVDLIPTARADTQKQQQPASTKPVDPPPVLVAQEEKSQQLTEKGEEPVVKNGKTRKAPVTSQKDKPPVSKNMFADVTPSPFAAEKQPEERALADRKSSLIKDADWEIPEDPTLIWYLSQGLSGITTTEIVSDIPGRVVIRVTRDMLDKFLSGHVLIPQHSLVIAEQASATSDTNRLSVILKQIEFPDGTILPLTSKVADQYGATGLTGKADYHIGRVLVAAGLSALLSIGTRVPTGNTEGFVPTVGQQTTQQLGADIARTGADIVKREVSRPVTITIPANVPLLIYPSENVSFAKPAKVIR